MFASLFAHFDQLEALHAPCESNHSDVHVAIHHLDGGGNDNDVEALTAKMVEKQKQELLEEQAFLVSIGWKPPTHLVGPFALSFMLPPIITRKKGVEFDLNDEALKLEHHLDSECNHSNVEAADGGKYVVVEGRKPKQKKSIESLRFDHGFLFASIDFLFEKEKNDQASLIPYHLQKL
uniref:Uncharacterized protein n=1 Tax=Nelumbo nucifera TaxID=4432 RepID=A0A822XLH9_NELNU|nr:TPA_asm: hypothetical protein HUJ06_022315 [Nelumbo nucifera]